MRTVSGKTLYENSSYILELITFFAFLPFVSLVNEWIF